MDFVLGLIIGFALTVMLILVVFGDNIESVGARKALEALRPCAQVTGSEKDSFFQEVGPSKWVCAYGKWSRVE